MIHHVAHLRWLLVLMISWMRACLLSESISIVLRVILISAADFLSSRTKSRNIDITSTPQKDLNLFKQRRHNCGEL